jgi:hypothetical protein
MLCGLAELVLSVVSILRMVAVRLSRDWHTDVAHAGLPEGENDKPQEKQTAAGSSERPKALMLNSRSGRRTARSHHHGPAGPVHARLEVEVEVELEEEACFRKTSNRKPGNSAIRIGDIGGASSNGAHRA